MPHIPRTGNESKAPAAVVHGGGGGGGGVAGCNGLMYDWLTALFIAAAAVPTVVKEILYAQPHYYKLTSIIMARNYNIWI